MEKKPRQTARKGVEVVLCLEAAEGSGPWDGAVDPEVGNTHVRKFMKWYRQRLKLSLHQVEALTGINRAYMRRLERRMEWREDKETRRQGDKETGRRGERETGSK